MGRGGGQSHPALKVHHAVVRRILGWTSRQSNPAKKPMIKAERGWQVYVHRKNE